MSMTVKSTVSFTEKHHEFAARKVKEDTFASIEALRNTPRIGRLV